MTDARSERTAPASVRPEATRPIEHHDIGVWQQVLHINLTAPFILTRCLLPLLRQSAAPAIVFTTSTVGHVAKAYWGAYAVSKFGLEGLANHVVDIF